MINMYLVPHTHWDREWYLTFQQFRLKLVRLIDDLLDLLAADPNYCSYTLDGQTILLDDYLVMRPEREAELRAMIQSGRLAIGPWHVLPDEFLVSPEAIIRNLLQGDLTASRFGPKMMVGYIPDPFGHVGQMPQILKGFGIGEACVQRGLADEPCEFWWQAPDGSQVLMLNLRERYSNASRLTPSNPALFVEQIHTLRDRLLPHTATSQVLLMYGDDHTGPDANTSRAVEFANHLLQEGSQQLLHATLAGFSKAVLNEIETRRPVLPTVMGELRSSKRYHLLPGVLSTRRWIKQRNHACETLLEKWAEPFSVFARQVEGFSPETLNGRSHIPRLRNTAPILRRAWRLLMECHPHDSICGCSVDQVHAEMQSRFDQVEQIGEEVTLQSLETVAECVNTSPPTAHPSASLLSAAVVFNANSVAATGIARVSLSLPAEARSLKILDDSGNVCPCHVGETRTQELINVQLDRAGFLGLLAQVVDGKVTGVAQGPLAINDIQMRRDGDCLFLQAYLIENVKPDDSKLEQTAQSIAAALADHSINRFTVVASQSFTDVEWSASQIPSFGYKTFWIYADTIPQAVEPLPGEFPGIENGFFRLELSPHDGTIHLFDKRTGITYHGLNRFVDGGDCGDEYNFCPPLRDYLVAAELVDFKVKRTATRQTLEAHYVLPAPAGLTLTRSDRLEERIPLQIITRFSLVAGVPQVEVHTEVDNTARDHRLRVHFPAPFAVTHADYDGHFEVVRRPVALPDYDSTWEEQPRPENPQRNFCAIHTSGAGLMVANRGLREVEVTSQDDSSEIILTLLRCVGWLSRGDLSTRKSHAGPALPTPGAQLPGKHSFDYAIIPFQGEPALLTAAQQAYCFNAPLRGQLVQANQGALPSSLSFLRVEPQEFSVTAIKEIAPGKEGNEAAWLVRGYNLTKHPLEVHLSTWQPASRVRRVNLAEDEICELEANADSCVTMKVDAAEIVTLKLTEFRNQIPAGA